jgi:hypothetical protein
MRKLSASKYDLLLYDWTSSEVYERSVIMVTDNYNHIGVVYSEVIMSTKDYTK